MFSQGKSAPSDLEIALKLADIADEISMQRYLAIDLVVETKPDLTPVSDADRAVEQAMCGLIPGARTAMVCQQG